MKEVEEITKIFNLCQQTSSFSNDLKSTTRKPNPDDDEYFVNDDELELTLGLSMNGRFGVDPRKMKKLKRSSSVSDFPLQTAVNTWDNDAAYTALESHAPPLPRTRSLPTEAEEELRKRKAYQSMRRLEVRKKRLEKMKCGNKLCGGGSLADEDGVRSRVVSGNGNVKGLVEPGSSASSDLDQGRQNQTVVAKEMLENTSMADMPYVTTKETGPNGRKTEGFLYGYKIGEEVRIVCVCHGIFLSPAEFVKHGGCGGGAGEVEHPLKHIVVKPFPFL